MTHSFRLERQLRPNLPFCFNEDINIISLRENVCSKELEVHIASLTDWIEVGFVLRNLRLILIHHSLRT